MLKPKSCIRISLSSKWKRRNLQPTLHKTTLYKIHVRSVLSFNSDDNFRNDYRSSRPEEFCKNGILRISQNSQENTRARVSFLIKLQAPVCNFIQKETLVQVFSSKFCEISKNTFSYRTPPVASSAITEIGLI